MPRWRKLLAPTLSLLLLTIAFTFDRQGIHWFWSAQPGVAGALAAGGAICLALMWFPRPGRKSAGREHRIARIKG